MPDPSRTHPMHSCAMRCYHALAWLHASCYGRHAWTRRPLFSLHIPLFPSHAVAYQEHPPLNSHMPENPHAPCSPPSAPSLQRSTRSGTALTPMLTGWSPAQSCWEGTPLWSPPCASPANRGRRSWTRSSGWLASLPLSASRSAEGVEIGWGNIWKM